MINLPNVSSEFIFTACTIKPLKNVGLDVLLKLSMVNITAPPFSTKIWIFYVFINIYFSFRSFLNPVYVWTYFKGFLPIFFDGTNLKGALSSCLPPSWVLVIDGSILTQAEFGAPLGYIQPKDVNIWIDNFYLKLSIFQLEYY